VLVIVLDRHGNARFFNKKVGKIKKNVKNVKNVAKR